MLFTTSWDDGYALDLRVSALLRENGVNGTFYVCPSAQHGLPMLSQQELKTLATHHEIGAHSLTHPRLSRLAPDAARAEILGSKRWVEEQTGKPCTMFCYPYGDHNPEVRHMVREAGFRGARSTESLRFTHGDNPFLLPASLQVSPFPLRRSFKKWHHFVDPLGPLRYRLKRLHELRVPLRARKSWLALATHLFQWALETNQPFFHLWGHSSEVERYGMWGDLEAFLKMAGTTKGVRHVTNSGLLI